MIYFYPRPPRGGRRVSVQTIYHYIKFLSTPSARRATRHRRRCSRAEQNFYPRPPRGGRHAGNPSRPNAFYFYPRPPRGGRRADKARHCQAGTISIHALREEGDKRRPAVASQAPIFLSTPSARRATATVWPAWTAMLISIHALREEGDIASPASRRRMCRFLSTPSARRATLHSGCTGCPG